MDPEESSAPPGQLGTQVEQLAPGQKVGGGRYTLIKILGRGGMGVVWLAQDERLGETVALKMLPPEIRADAVALDDMRRETLKSRKLTHPNIIRIHDLYVAEGEVTFISMEYVDGPNLSDLRLQQPDRFFTWEYLRPLVKQLCEALEYAHSEKVVHRDLKPGNMMLDSRGRLKLADFGIAAVASDSVSRVSLRHLTSGTPTHMSPQQMEGHVPRPADDIYALGATLYELLTSKPPFYTGDIIHQVKTVHAQPVAERLADLELSNPVPADVSALIMACLAKDPAQRPQSALAVAEWIGLAASKTPGTEHLAATLFGGGALDGEGGSAVEPLAEEDEVAPKSNALVWVGLAVMGVLMLGMASWYFGIFNREKAVPPAEKVAPTGLTASNAVVSEQGPPPPTVEEKSAVPDGSLDASFDPEGGPDGRVLCLAVQRDGKVLIGGEFTHFNGIPVLGLARLTLEGKLDSSFKPEAAKFNTVHTLAVMADGTILAAGGGDTRIARLNPDGSLSDSFHPGSQTDLEIRRVCEQADGKILIGGSFSVFNGVHRTRIARLNADGSVDLSFDPRGGPDSTVWDIVPQPDGKILICGHFEIFDRQTMRYLARLNANGSVDATFHAPVVTDHTILALALQPDGKILAGGTFGEISGFQSKGLTRLNADGSLDTSFDAQLNKGVHAIAWCADGRILIGGGFTTIHAKQRRCIARLLPNGQPDLEFKPGYGADKAVFALAPKPEGKIYIVGDFTKYDGSTRVHVARLNCEKIAAPRVKAAPGPWETLFDGKSVAAWRGYNVESFPGGWQVENGVLKAVPNGSQVDLVTRAKYSSFELVAEWKAAAGANSRIYYRLTEGTLNAATGTALGYEILDDAKYPKRPASQLTGALFGLIQPNKNKHLASPGVFNETKIIVRGNHVEHWLNGAEILEYELGSPEFFAVVGATKLRLIPHYTEHLEGHIGLQNYGSEVSFQNIRIRRLADN